MAYKYLNDNGLKTYTKKVKGALKDLHTPIAISTENTTESKAQNVRNIADFVAKAKAAGIENADGMAVTCLIDNNYSGVGYIYAAVCIIGTAIADDLTDNQCFVVQVNGEYTIRTFVTVGDSNSVSSQMLTQGTRKPIILTSSTTEVDEKTYQKLISDDVDVMFIATDGNLCGLTYKTENDDNFGLMFSCFSVEGETDADIYIYGYDVSITKNSPHTCFISEQLSLNFANFLNNSGYITKNTLTPVLQEIDLTGTDAQRKAKLDQFERDWKALTGANDLTGARFVGKIQYDQREYVYCGIFVWLPIANSYYAIMSNGSDGGSDSSPVVATVAPSNGAIYIDYLFSHLEPITIRTGSTTADIAANKAAIKAYRENLVRLGIEPLHGYQASVVVKSDGEEYTGTLNKGTGLLLKGIVTDVNETHHYPFHIDVETGIVTFDKTNYFLEKTSNEVTEMLDAIKYSYTQVPLTATTSTNKTQLDLFLSKVPNAQVMQCTYKDVYAGTLHKIGTDWFGLLVKNTNNYEDALQVKLQADGTIIEGTTSLAQVNAKLDNIIG